MRMQGIEEVLNRWEAEAAEMATMLMEMEKAHVSSVFFQRLAIKRKQRGAVEIEPSRGKFASAARSMRASGAGFMSKVGGVFSRKKKGAEEPQAADGGLGSVSSGRQRPRPPPQRRSTADDETGGGGGARERRERPSSNRGGPEGASFARQSRDSVDASQRSGTFRSGIYQPKQAANVAFVQHIPKWGVHLATPSV